MALLSTQIDQAIAVYVLLFATGGIFSSSFNDFKTKKRTPSCINKPVSKAHGAWCSYGQSALGCPYTIIIKRA